MSRPVVNGAEYVRGSLNVMPRRLEGMYQKMRPEYNTQDEILRKYNTLDHLVQTDNRGNRFLRLQFDMRNFRRQEINVKAERQTLTIEARSVGSKDGVQETDEYSRCYRLPSYINIDTLTTNISDDGMLQVVLSSGGVPPQQQHQDYTVRTTQENRVSLMRYSNGAMNERYNATANHDYADSKDDGMRVLPISLQPSAVQNTVSAMNLTHGAVEIPVKHYSMQQ